MNDRSSQKILEMVGLSAVVLSLLFVAYQIQQANRIAVVTNEIEIRNSYLSLNVAQMTDSDVIALVTKLKLETKDVDLTPEEKARTVQWRNSLLNVWIATETAYDNQMLPQQSFDLLLNDIRAVVIGYPGALPIFREALDGYPGFATSIVFSSIDEILVEHGY